MQSLLLDEEHFSSKLFQPEPFVSTYALRDILPLIFGLVRLHIGSQADKVFELGLDMRIGFPFVITRIFAPLTIVLTNHKVFYYCCFPTTSLNIILKNCDNISNVNNSFTLS
jgi:hypothetical protein